MARSVRGGADCDGGVVIPPALVFLLALYGMATTPIQRAHAPRFIAFWLIGVVTLGFMLAMR